MIHLACIIVGLYVLLNAVYLGGQSEGEHRHCMIARYVCAGMSGGYMAWLSIKDIAYHLILNDKNHLYISDSAMEIMLLLGLTIALFMWQDTFWRVVEYLQKHKPTWHIWLVTHFNVTSRRLRDG